MSLLQTTNISATGLTAQSLRMDIIAENIANVNTTRTADGGPYKRQAVIFQEKTTGLSFNDYLNNAITDEVNGKGVMVSNIYSDSSQGDLVYDPSHPDANGDGYVEMPNVNIVEEMVNMISTSRSYEANVTSLNMTKSMIAKTMEIGR